MIKCSFCGATYVPNTLFCNECGAYLLDEDNRPTDPLGTDEIGWVGQGEHEHEAGPKKTETGPLAVRLKVVETGRKIEAMLSKAVNLGRLDATSDVYPEVDLTSDNGMDKGVSRRHARILIREGVVVVEDLGSINGTFVNGKRLAPYLPEALNDNDQLQLGKLLIEVELQ